MSSRFTLCLSVLQVRAPAELLRLQQLPAAEVAAWLMAKFSGFTSACTRPSLCMLCSAYTAHTEDATQLPWHAGRWWAHCVCLRTCLQSRLTTSTLLLDMYPAIKHHHGKHRLT
jgi:hypothetical protein